MVRLPAFAICLFVACGGIVTGPLPDGGASAGVDASADSGTSPCVIRASSYDQSCHSDADCVSVFDGNVCSAHCQCENSGINRSALAKYKAEYPRTDGGGAACPCPPQIIACLNNLCAPCNGSQCSVPGH